MKVSETNLSISVQYGAFLKRNKGDAKQQVSHLPNGWYKSVAADGVPCGMGFFCPTCKLSVPFNAPDAIAACNRFHSVDGRLARWLLMCQDRLGSDRISVTQKFLAGMQGTRRAGISVAFGVLQKSRLIAYQRGEVTITNRRKLEAAACECYKTLSQQLREWRGEADEREKVFN